MFYIKTKLGDNTAINTRITDENVYTHCPDCGRELHVDLSDIAIAKSLDLKGMHICCPRCSKARWRTSHRGNRPIADQEVI